MLVPLLAAAASATPSSYPSFADYAGASYNVSYDSRALTLNGEHALFVSGAVHPPRGTQGDWASWFASAKSNGLNMLQVYVFWNFHEEVEGEFNFEGRGNLSEFVRQAGAAGMFVNLRIGPYVCAEWTYGGLPTWLGLKPGVAFRQTNAVWQPAMKKFFEGIVERMAASSLFATQGGPIVLVQVENELPATDKTYVEWCGTMAHAALASVKVDVPVTMCNGETATTAINTCNGNDCADFLEKHGQNGRVLVDQPALWTENEGGFQTWGGAPPPGKEPYFWGRAISDQAESVLRWFARGGSHMNYYMWVGGNNFGRWTGDSITTMYADDAIVCPDGLAHEPKFSITSQLHGAIARAAAEVGASPAQLGKGVEAHGAGGAKATAYIYGSVAFLELDQAGSAGDAAAVTLRGHTLALPGGAGSISLVNLTDGETLFNSRTAGAAPKATRQIRPLGGGASLSWSQWAEPILAKDVPPGTYPASASFSDKSPREMTNFTLALAADRHDAGARSRRSTFAFYETAIPAGATKLTIGTTQAMAFEAFVDGGYAGVALDLTHGNGGSIEMSMALSPAAPAATTTALAATATMTAAAKRRMAMGAAVEEQAAPAPAQTLTLLAEEMGYANYGFLGQLKKGLVGDVTADGAALGASGWKMRGGLAGEQLGVFTAAGAKRVKWSPATATAATTTGGASGGKAATWYRATFATPAAVAPGGARLLFNASGLDRGRLWINGHDAGRYFLKPRNDASQCADGAAACATQTLYYLPASWLAAPGSGTDNVLTLFEAGATGSLQHVGLALASMASSEEGSTSSGGGGVLDSVLSCAF